MRGGDPGGAVAGCHPAAGRPELPAVRGPGGGGRAGRGHPGGGAEPADRDPGGAGAGILDGPGDPALGGVPGRPVSPNSALGLAIAPGEDEPVGWRALDGMALRSRLGLVDLDAPPQLLEGGIASLRVFAGYAGWGPGQVQAEIEEGAWYVLPAEPADAFAAEPERLWQMVLRRAGGTLALVATYPDDPALN